MKKTIQILLLSVCALASAFSASQAQSNEPYQISGEMVPLGDVTKYEISPDGKYIVYIADQELDQLPQLYSVPISGGTPTRLSEAAFIFLFPVFDFKISQDSKHVVFTQDLNISTLSGEDRNERMVSVPITGGDNIDLSDGAINDIRTVAQFSISSDSQRVVYLSDNETEDVFELYSSLISGGTLTKLNTNLPIRGDVIDFKISPNNQRVIFQSDLTIDNTFELYSVWISGGAVVTLNGALTSGGDVLSFQISPNSERVVYRANQRFDNEFSLYSVPLAGGRIVGLTGFGLDVSGRFDVSADSQQVVYRAARTGQRIDLFSVPIAGGGSVNLNPNLTIGGDDSFQISPNSQQFVYEVNQGVDNLRELYSVSITGGDPEKLNGSLADQGPVLDFKISPDSQRVLYVGSLGIKLFSLSINGGTGTKLGDDISVNNVFNGNEYQISRDSQKVIYLSDQDQSGVDELYIIDIAGGRVSKLNADLPFQSDVDDFELSPDGKFVVYRSDQNVFDKLELFAVELEDEDDELCVPIKTKNGNVAIICL